MAKTQLYNYQGDRGVRNSLSIVQDPFSSKFYGDVSYKDLMIRIGSATKHFEKIIKGDVQPSYDGINSLSPSWGNLKRDPVKDAKEKLSHLSSFNIKQEDYTQKDNMIASYDKYGANWNKFFEGSYKNPRLDEANQSAVAPKQSSDLTIPTNKIKTPKLTGTGVSSPASSTNSPFGTLDVGLNI